MVTLTACTTDSVFDDVDNQNNSSQTANGTNGGMTTNSYTGGNAANPDGYGSHWDIHRRPEMYYHYENTTEYYGTPATRLIFEVTPYIGLAYSDNDPADGTFFDMSDPFYSENLIGSPFQYPNMYQPTSNEIGNFVPAKPITVSGVAAPLWGNTALKVFSLDHCHVLPTFTAYYNPNGVFFDISSPPAPYQPSTTQEQDFLSKYGKVHFYYWEAKDPATFAVVASGYVTPFCDTSNASYWADTNVPASNLPIVGSKKLYENILCNDTGNRSYELVLEADTYPSETVFNNAINGRDYKVSIETFRTGYYPYGPGVGGISMGGTISTLKLELD